MTTIFLSGSRSISRLAPQVQERLLNIIGNEFDVVVGDANGADKAVQKFLSAKDYRRVTVYHVGDSSRNNAGGWPSVQVESGRAGSGWERYAQKDKQMAQIADYGMVLWDGESSGSIHNVLELVKNAKPAVVFFAPEKTFVQVKNMDDATALLKKANEEVQQVISDKIRFSSYGVPSPSASQFSFGF